MQSKTSCFNKTLFWKHITRFWPIWAAYFVIWLLLMPIGLLSQREYILMFPVEAQQSALQAIGAGVVMSAFFSVFMAMAVWSFLYSARSASGAACLPLTRTAQFTSAALAGFLPLAVIHAVTFLLTLLAEASIGVLHLPSLLTWLGATLLALLFFYGFATFCAMLTGNIIVLPAVYGVLNFVAAGLYVLLNALAGYFLYGFQDFGGDWLLWLSPAVGMMSHVNPEPIQIFNPATQNYVTTGYRFDGWIIFAIYAVVGVLFVFAALALLRRRRMETAGDVVAVQALKPVFRWCMGIGAGICFADMMLYVFNLHGETQRMIFVSTAVWLVIGAFLGWFIAEMLIRRSFRVFRGGWRGFGGWALCCAVLLLGLTATELDLFGYERRQPSAEQINGVYIHAGGEGVFLASPESVEQVMTMHKNVIGRKAEQDQCAQQVFFLYEGSGDMQVVNLRISYSLKNGSVISRSYQLPHRIGDGADDASTLQALLNTPEAVQARKETPFPFTAENVTYGSISATMPAEKCAELAGYDDPETYVLCELAGYSLGEAANLPDDERDRVVFETLESWSYSEANYLGDYYENGQYVQKFYGGDGPVLQEGRPIVWDKVWLNYTVQLTKQEAWELYSTCVLPDLAANALGRVWILPGSDYEATVYSASLEIAAKWPADPNSPQTVQAAYDAPVSSYPAATAEGTYSFFHTVPTVDSARTNAFFAAHGLTLSSVGVIRGAVTP